MHTLITIGWLGSKRAYLDISREDALRRYAKTQYTSLEEAQAAPYDEFQFTDEFYTYEAGPSCS